MSNRAKKKATTIFPVLVLNDLDLRPIPFLRRLIRREAYDVVHFHTKRAHARLELREVEVTPKNQRDSSRTSNRSDGVALAGVIFFVAFLNSGFIFCIFLIVEPSELVSKKQN